MKYDVILADPPWRYNNRANHKTRFRGGASGHYSLMTMDEIKALPVESMVADNAALFLWVTFPYLKEQLEVFKAWGFEYKTVGFTWVKLNRQNRQPFFGVGYYTKSNAELCLFGTRGKMKPATNGISSVIVAPRGPHSQKPQEARLRIEQLYPNARRLEMFARIRTGLFTEEGWSYYGNEADGSIAIGVGA